MPKKNVVRKSRRQKQAEAKSTPAGRASQPQGRKAPRTESRRQASRSVQKQPRGNTVVVGGNSRQPRSTRSRPSAKTIEYLRRRAESCFPKYEDGKRVLPTFDRLVERPKYEVVDLLLKEESFVKTLDASRENRCLHGMIYYKVAELVIELQVEMNEMLADEAKGRFRGSGGRGDAYRHIGSLSATRG